MTHQTRLSGISKKSRFSSVACRINKWRAIGFGLIVCASLFITTIGYTQTGMLDGLRHAGNVIQQVKRKEEQAREGLERYQRWVREARDMEKDQQSFINEVEMEKGLRKFTAQIPAGEETGYRYSTNSYGANYSVPNGSYRGDGQIGLRETWIPGIHGPVIQDRIITQGRDGDRSIGNGWSFEPGGFLKEEYQTVNISYEPGLTHCSVVLRYTYASANGGSNFQQRGNEQAINFDLKGTVGAYFCASAGAENFRGSQPTQFWSDDGQIALDMSSQPVMRYPDGSFLKLSTQPDNAYIPFNAGLYDYLGTGSAIGGLWFLSQSVNRNGQITNYSYDGNGWLQSVTDFRGRVTQYIRDGSGRVQTITSPGPGGTQLNWHMTWEERSWDPVNEFQNSEIQCLSNGNSVSCAGQLTYTTLTRLQLPDSRSYAFTYGLWGNLTRVIEPDGAVRDFEYGGVSTSAFLPPGEILGALGTLPAYTLNLQKRRVTSTTIHPQGLAGPANTTQFRHENTQDLGTSGQCTTLFWIKTTYPNGDISRTALCSQLPGANPNLNGKTFAEEILRDGAVLSATYYGNLGTFGDTTVPVGTMYLDAETSHDPIQENGGVTFLDVRPNQVVHFKDGVMWTEEFKYESSTIPADGQVFRTTGNVTQKRIRDASGALVSRTITTYFHNDHPAYLDRNLLRLPASVRLQDGADHVLTRTEYDYDQFTPTASGAPNLDTSIQNVRGNATTITSYRDAVTPALPVSLETRYFDTGDVQVTFDPLRRNPTTNTYTFGLCSSNPLLTNTVANVFGQQTITVSDCHSGLTLKVTDPNAQSVYSQYDNLGRLFETAGPGDTLTPIPNLVRDPGAILNSGNKCSSGNPAVGNCGQGPTTWYEYFRLGLEASDINQQRRVMHAKDGTADGLYVKTFLDGLGRTTQTRSEIDPATSQGNAENVTTTNYDNMGRVSAAYVPCFSSQTDTYAPCSTLATITQYDALGRVTSVTPPGLPATTNYYLALGSKWRTMIVDANGHQSDIVTDVLGHTVKTSRSWLEGGKMACVDPELGMLHCATTMDVDAAGRLKSTTDPSGNIMSFIYDGLSRKTDMTDPDMGHWHYEYDDNGNLTSQTDAKGQVISMQYDALNRITLKDLPPAGAGEEDVKYFYDGEQSTTCYSCDDHDVNTQDCCDPATGTCYHQAAGTTCGSTICTYALTPTSVSLPAGGGNFSFTVTAATGCAWTATSNASWITTSSSGSGNGTVNYTVASNPGAARTGTITLNDQTFTVSQAAGCTYTLSPTSASPPAGGGNGSFTVTTATGCAWTATSNASWITTSSSGSGNGTVNYSVANNTGPARSGTITVVNQTFTVNQAAGCTYSISPTSASSPASGGNGSFTVTTATGCAWTATSNASWITTSSSGSGNGTVNYTVASNPGAARTGTISVANQTFTVNQAAGCTYSISPTSASSPASGGNGSFAVTATTGCTWTASSNASWITTSSSGSGNGTVNYSVANNTGPARSGTITVVNQTFTVNQASGCSYSLSPPNNLSIPPAGVTGAQITVNASTGCAWTAVSLAPWITINGGSAGNGNGVVTYSVQTNPGSTTRYGSIQIANLYFDVSQDACGYFIQPTSEMFSYTGTQESIQVSAQGGCSWSAQSNAAWITINSGSSGSGSGTVLITVAPNTTTTSPTTRTGTLTIAGQTFTATQGGQPTCPQSMGLSCSTNPFVTCNSGCFQSTGGSGTVYVNLSRTDCDWHPQASVSWIHTSWVDNGQNPRIVNYTVDPNNLAPSRVGAIMIGGLSWPVTEGGTSSSASGRVTTNSGQGLAGVTIHFSALKFYSGIPADVVTDANGYWTQSGFLVCKGVWAEASRSGYTFAPTRSNTFNPGALHVDFVGTPTQASNGLRLENIARGPSVNPVAFISTRNRSGEEDSSSNQTPADKKIPVPHDPTGFALLGCVAIVFAVRLYKPRRPGRCK